MLTPRHEARSSVAVGSDPIPLRGGGHVLRPASTASRDTGTLALPRLAVPAPRRRSGPLEWALPLAGALAFQIVLVVTYRTIILSTFASQRWPFGDPGLLVVAGAMLINLVPLAVLPRAADTPARIIIWLLYMIVLLPGGLLPHITGRGTISDHVVWQAMLVASFTAAALTLYLPRRRVSGLEVARRFPLVLPIFIWVVAVAVVVGVRGLRLSFLSLADVYEVRSSNSADVAQVALLGYLAPWLQNVASPLLFVAGWYQRRWVLVAMGIAGEYLVYQSLGNRQALVGVLLMLGCLVLLRRLPATSVPAVIPLVGTLMILAVLGFDGWRGGVLATALLVLRLFIVQGVLTGDYLDFFSAHPWVWLRDGLLSSVAKSPYSYGVVNLISLVYYGSPVSTSNSHIWADGFANFGYLGFVLIPIGFGVVLWLVDGATTTVPPAVTVAAMSFCVIAWSNSSLATSLVTLGVAPLLFILLVTGGTVLTGTPVSTTPAAIGAVEAEPVVARSFLGLRPVVLQRATARS